MKRLFSVLAVLVGVALVAFGLLFLVGAGGRLYRYVIAAVSLALGGVLVGVGVRLFKQAEAASPAQLRAEILELARREDGEVSEGEVLAALGRRAGGAPAVLQALVREGICERRLVKGATYYRFAQLQPRLMVLRCEYCNAELPLSEKVSECPNCGGTVKTQVESRALSSGDLYGMDE